MSALISVRRIFQNWWPLAASWVFMAVELPVLSAVVARLPDPEIHLAAYGGIVFPLALIIEAPIIMLLAASTALSKDWDSYVKIRRFMHTVAGTLTAIHILVAFTPLYFFVVEDLIGAPLEIIGPARTGLIIMTPWTWSIAYRRFNQGVLIRFGHAQTVTIGTVVRLSADVLVLSLGFFLGLPGIVVATTAVAAGVISEAFYVGVVVRPVRERELKSAPRVKEPVTLPSFLSFYIPLALNSLLFLLAQPIGSAALSRMPQALESLAVWPVISGLIFIFRSLGMAYNEVTVALLDEEGSFFNLRRFAMWLAAGASAGLFLMAATPLASFWFTQVSALKPDLAELARRALWLAIPMPALTALQSFYQGLILHGKKTRGIPEAVGMYLLTSAFLLGAGVFWGGTAGLYIGLVAMAASMLVQTVWLGYRSRKAVRAARERDENMEKVVAGAATD